MNEIDLKTIFEQLPGHIYWKDKNGVFLGCNESNATDFGMQASVDYVGKTNYDVFSYEQAEQLEKIDRKVISTGQLIVAEEECIRTDGTSSLYLSHKVPLRNKDNEIIGVLGVSVDITEARKDELERLEMLEDIIAIMPGHVYWVSRENVYLGCNDNQAKSAGLNSRKEIIGKRNKDLPWNENSDVLPEELDRVNEEVMQTGNPVVIEEPAVLQDGTVVNFLSSKVPMRNRNNKVIGMVGLSIDITAEKEAEKLRLEKIAAEERAETMKLFSATMAHELRTPLRAIESGALGIAKYLPQLLDVYEKAKTAGIEVPYISPLHYKSLSKVFDNITSEARSAFSIIDMLLVKANSSQIDTSGFKTCAIADCVEQALQRYPFESGEHGLVHWHKFDFKFFGDELLMTHVLFNLLKNALHYVQAAAKGDIQIWCDKNEEFNILYFKDTGQGVAPDILPHIFERFYSRTTHGTGVGLAFCHVVMQSFGGDIRCDSVQGEYTQFGLYFPKYAT